MELTRKLTLTLLTSTAIGLAATLAAPTASAQEQDAVTTDDDAATDRRLSTVIVKSTKRDTTLQDAPISIGVVTGETVADYSITDLTDLQGFVPNLVVQKTFGNYAVRIRGLGSGVTNIAFDSSVSIFNDGIYCGRSSCLEAGFLDVGAVEVARGPQGALFGKSTIAGAITVNSARPTDTFEAYATVAAELEDGGYRTSGAVSGPVSDTFRLRLAGSYRDLDGDVKNLATGKDDNSVEDWAARLSAEWDLGPNTMLFTKLEGASSEVLGRRNQLVSAGALLSPTFPGNPANIETNPDQVRNVSTGVSTPEYDERDQFSISGQLDTRIGDHDLQLIAGHWQSESERYLDVDGVPEALLNTSIGDDYDQQSFEARLLSPSGGAFEYILGGLYHQSDVETYQYSSFFPAFYQTVGVPPAATAAIPGATGALRSFSRSTETVSLYGQLTWYPTDRLSVIADFRYTEEEQEGRAQNRQVVFPDGVTLTFQNPAPFQSDPEFILLQNRKDESFDPSLRLLYEVTPDINVYAAYSTGSKPGGLKANDPALGTVLLSRGTPFQQKYAGAGPLTAADLNTGITLKQGNGVFDFEEETAENYEIGTKMVLANGKVNFNATAFLMEFDNLQTSSYDGQRFIIGNAASAEVSGLELEGQWLATDNLRLNGSAAFTDAKYDEFLNAQCPIGSDGNLEDPACVDGQGDLSGRQIERAPEVEFNLGANWNGNITENLVLDASTDVYYSGEYFVRQDFDPLGKQDAYTKINARLGIGPEDGRWEIALVGRNITDEVTIQHAYEVISSFQALGEGRKVYLEGTVRW